MKKIMKTLIGMAFCVAGISLSAKAQDIPQNQVPSVVLNALQVKFPNAKEVEWELKGDQYKADFEVGKRDHDVWIDKTGNIKKHKEDFPKSELPQAIGQALEKDFKTYKLDDVDKLDQEGKITYEVKLESESEDLKIMFTPEGKVLEKKVD
jgi:hypothetical protein